MPLGFMGPQKIFSIIDSKMAFRERFSFLMGFSMGKIVDKWSPRNLAIRMQSFILRFSIATAFYELRADFLDWTADCESRISCNPHAIHTIQGQFSAMPDCNHLTQSSTIQCNPTQLRWIEGGLRVLCDTNVMQVTKQYLKHQLVCSVERAKRIF